MLKGRRNQQDKATQATEAEASGTQRSGLLEARQTINAEIRERIDPDALGKLDDKALLQDILRVVENIADKHRMLITGDDQKLIAQEIADDLRGVGPLEALMKDDEVSDILVNGVDQIYADRRGKGMMLTGLSFRNEEHLNAVAQRIARNVGRKVDESSPMVDARLADGSRVNVIFRPLALDGAAISIRKFPKDSFQLTDLVTLGSMSDEMAEFLKLAAAARLNFLISGGTGSGKTTLMNAVTRHFGVDDRIITIEDSAELQVQQPHVVRLETRPPSGEGGHAVTQTHLVKNALRMRPDRILLGEVRGGETFDMLQAMNTGHDGSGSTLHANSPRDVLARVETMVLMAGYDLPARAIRSQVASAVDIIIQVSRLRDRSRKVLKISEVQGMEDEKITMSDLFSFEIDSSSTKKITGQFKPTNTLPKRSMEKFRSIGVEADVRQLFG